MSERHHAMAHQYARLLIPQIRQESSSKGGREGGGMDGYGGERGASKTDRSSSENNRMNGFGRGWGCVIVGRQLLIG